MKDATVYAKSKIVTVYSQPSLKTDYAYDTVLQSEEVGFATGQSVTNANGTFLNIGRIGVSAQLWVKSTDVTYNFEDSLGNLLPEAKVIAKTVSNKKNLPWIVGGVAAVIIVIILIVSD